MGQQEYRAIGRRIRAAREHKGWTQRDLATRLTAASSKHEYIHHQEIGRWERGEHLPHPLWRRLLCQVLEETFESLGFIEMDDEHPPPSPLEMCVAYLQALISTYQVFSFATRTDEVWLDEEVYVDLPLSAHAAGIIQQRLTGRYMQELLAEESPVRMLLLGGPGSGKTTLLKHLVYAQARRALVHPDAPLPVFVSLPEWSRSQKTLQEYLLEVAADLVLPSACGEWLVTLLSQGALLLCLDGLDEVYVERIPFLQRLHTFLRNASARVAILMSSRYTFGDDFQVSSSLRTWHLLPLHEASRRTLAQRLFGRFARLFGEQYTDPHQFLQQFEQHPRLAQWSRIPLLFSLVAFLYAQTGRLPLHRHEVYVQIIDALLARREPLPERRVLIRRALAAVAYELLFVQHQRAISLDALITILERFHRQRHATWDIGVMARHLLNSGILVPEGRLTYRFIHQTFAEFLTVHAMMHNEPAALEQDMERILVSMHIPSMVPIACELAYTLHDRAPDLEAVWYERIIQRYVQAMLAMEWAEDAERARQEAAMGSGLFACIETVADIWRTRYCATILRGQGERLEDTKLMTSLMWPLEMAPHDENFPALHYALYAYPIKGRTLKALGHLGGIGNQEARDLLVRFAREHYVQNELPLRFRDIAPALALAHASEGIPTLRLVRDREDYPLPARYAAHQALGALHDESTFDEGLYYNLDHLRSLLAVSEHIDQLGKVGQITNWETIQQTAGWLVEHVDDPRWPWLREQGPSIASLLEGVLDHPHEHARLPAIRALQHYGTEQTYRVLIQRLEYGQEAVWYVAQATLETLITLALTLPQQGLPVLTQEALDRLHHEYPALESMIVELYAHWHGGEA